jgi:hypothetical protein
MTLHMGSRSLKFGGILSGRICRVNKNLKGITSNFSQNNGGLSSRENGEDI